MSDPKNYPRNTMNNTNEPNNAVIDEELSRLLVEGLDDYRIMLELKKKYSDQKLIDAIFDAYKLKVKKLNRYAGKFKELVLHKYGKQNLSYSELIAKAKKYAKHHKITDDQINFFIKQILSDKPKVHGDINVFPNTPLAKTLGYTSLQQYTTGLNYDVSDGPILKEIFRIGGSTKGLHNQIIIQTVTYQDSAPQVLLGVHKIDPYKKNNYTFIHPILFALFVPKIKLLDEIMLLSNIAGLVQLKHEQKAPQTKPDNELYWNFIHDPSESACDSTNALADLRNRAILQTKIWDSVLHLRQGLFYDDRTLGFLDALDACESKFYDFPDLSFVQDEGTILKKMLAAFGIRPTVVATSIIYQGNSPYNSVMMGNDTLFNTGISNITNVTTIPMLTLRLPLRKIIRESVVEQAELCLEDTFTQVQWFVNPDKSIVPKAQSVIHTESVLFFYVARRYQTIDLRKIGLTCNFSTLPMTISSMEALNDHPVNFGYTIQIASDTYKLRSVVCVECAPQNKLIIGCTAAVIVPASVSQGRYEDTCILYDPINATIAKLGTDGNYTRDAPVMYIPKEDPPLPTRSYGEFDYYPSLHHRARFNGTIFVYVKEDETCYIVS